MNVTPKLLERIDDAAAGPSSHWIGVPWQPHAPMEHHPSRLDIILFTLGLIPKRWRERMAEHLVDCEKCRGIHEHALPAVVRMQTRERRRRQRQSYPARRQK